MARMMVLNLRWADLLPSAFAMALKGIANTCKSEPHSAKILRLAVVLFLTMGSGNRDLPFSFSLSYGTTYVLSASGNQKSEMKVGDLTFGSSLPVSAPRRFG